VSDEGQLEQGATIPGRAGLIALLVCTMFPMLGLFAIGMSLPSVAAAFADQPNADILAQLIGGASGLAFACASPVIGMMIDRFGYRQIYIYSLIGYALFGALPVLLDSLPLIVVTRLFFGVTVAGTITAGMAGLGTLPPEIRSRMFGRNAMMASVGAIVVFPLVGALATYGWRTPFYLYLLSLLLVPLAMTLKPDRPRKAGRGNEGANHAGPAGEQPDDQRSAKDAGGSGLGVSPGILMMAAFIGLAMYIGPVFSPFYLTTIGVTDPRLAALPMSAMSIASLLMTANYARLHSKFGTTGLFGATLSLVGLGLIGAGLSPVLPLFIAGMFFVACGLAMFTPNLGTHISGTSSRPARGIGWAMSAMFAVQVAFPFIVNAIEGALGPASVFLLLGGTAVIVALGFIFTAWRRARPLA